MSLYPPNTIHWRSGDVVLHAADAKEPKMFMRVIGYTRDGLCKTQYVDPSHKRTIYTNPTTELLQIHDFDLWEFTTQEEWEAVKLWNLHCPVGTLVEVETVTRTFRAVTRSKAWLAGHTHALVLLEGHTGGFFIRRGMRVIG